ncbi:MAG: hypothetical protein J6Y79_01155 [Paludibacteraceae bacterium]|nr:hypothetical protein [Paludibacteraceae bacterium]
MLRRDDLIPVGRAGKTHGYKGEVTVFLEDTDFDEEAVHYFVFEINGLFTPYFIEAIRYAGNGTAYIKFEGIDDDVRAKNTLIGKDLYLERAFADPGGEAGDAEEETPEESDVLRRLIHYSIIDSETGEIGIVKRLDLQTANPLFVVEGRDGRDILIPIAEAFITRIDDERHIIHTSLPEGLITL